jgi:phosphoglycolate phosphatase-like HAD superfamily hydrolase
MVHVRSFYCRALLFDLDGVLVDSAECVAASCRRRYQVDTVSTTSRSQGVVIFKAPAFVIVRRALSGVELRQARRRAGQ